MVRGINRKIIEINNVEGGYFEKILFFVSDEKHGEPDDVLNDKAEHYITDVCSLKYRRGLSPSFFKIIFRMLTAAGAGFAAAMFFVH